MKKVIFFILLILSVNITATVYSMDIFDGKVVYKHTAAKVPSRVSIVMVPTAKSASYTDSDVYGMTGGTFNNEGEHVLEILPRIETPTGEYTLIINADGVKSTVDIKWLTESDKKIYVALNAINDALYQELENVIREHIQLMPEGFTMKEYDSLHIDYRTKVMKALSTYYTFTTLEQFKTEFDGEVSKAKSAQKDAEKRPSSGGGGGGSSSGTVSAVAVPSLQTKTDAPAVTQKQIFNDLDGYEWAVSAIENLCTKGVVSGYGDGNYMPQSRVTRAEFSAMLVRLMGMADSTATVVFDDVKQNDWFYVYVATAKKAGFINGRSETQFSPLDNITRAEAVIMIHNVLNSKGFNFESKEVAGFTDISALDEVICEKISQLSSIGVIYGRDEKTFAPYDNLTRAEAAVIINRIIRYI